jgi:DNA-binding HxlR family transcriptional regulator
MRWQDIDQQVCSVARALAVVGDRWTLLILRDAFLGTRRFEDFQRQLEISRHRLSDRLGKLVDAGIFSREPYCERPLRHEYRLTRKGLALYPVLMTLAQWGTQWCDDGNGAPVQYQHHLCGEMVQPVMSCSECGERLQPAEVTPVVGPGLEVALQRGSGMYGESATPGQLPPLLKRPAGSADQSPS